MPSNSTSRSQLLDKLNQEASIATSSANEYSIRAWVTSAKKCLDQAEEDIRENDPEAAYVNYVKAISIIVEVIPRHRGMKELEERQTAQALDYWAFRKRISLAFSEVQKLQEILRSRDYANKSESNTENKDGDKSSSSQRDQKLAIDRTLSIDNSIPKTVTPPISSKSFKISRKKIGIGNESSSLNGSEIRYSRETSSEPNLRPTFSGKRSQSQPQSPPLGNENQSSKPQKPNFPKSSLIEPSLLLSYLNQPLLFRPSILLLDVRPKEEYEKGCLNTKQVVWIDPILLDEEKSGKSLEESLVLSPKEQQTWFANRHQFDLVVIYDEDSRINSYAGGPIFDQHQLRLRNLTVAIFDYAGYMKPLKHVPMLLVGGIRAWCHAVRENPLRQVQWDVNESGPVTDTSNKTAATETSRQPPKIDLHLTGSDLDLDAESRWLQSIQLRSPSASENGAGVDSVPQNQVDGTSSDPYNKTLLDFFQKFPSVEPESMLGKPKTRSPGELDPTRETPYQQKTNGASVQVNNRRQSTFIDHPFHGFTEVKDPEFQPPTPTKRSNDHFDRLSTASSSGLAPVEDGPSLSERRRIPSIGGQISQVGPVSAGMTGLKNLGNTCYMNAILQCMSATLPLARYFLSGSYRRSINVNNPLGSKGILATSFAELIKHLWGDQYTHISPVSLRSVIGKLQPRFRNSDQQDAQDFLDSFLDGLHEDLNENALKSKLRELTPDEERRREKLPLSNISKIEWERYKHNHKSFLVELFQGQFVSSLRCSVCGQTSTTCNPFMNLSVEISLPHGPKGLQLVQCIEAFVKEEVLEGSNAWNCPNCKRPQRAIKQLRIARLPPILIIHLKRFHYAGPWRDKLNTFIDYPLRDLDLTRFVLADPKESDNSQSEMKGKFLYDLYAVTNHFGTLSGGHYTASIHNMLRDKWYVFDDSRVSPCDDSSVVARAGYILWYKRSNQF